MTVYREISSRNIKIKTVLRHESIVIKIAHF